MTPSRRHLKLIYESLGWRWRILFTGAKIYSQTSKPEYDALQVAHILHDMCKKFILQQLCDKLTQNRFNLSDSGYEQTELNDIKQVCIRALTNISVNVTPLCDSCGYSLVSRKAL